MKKEPATQTNSTSLIFDKQNLSSASLWILAKFENCQAQINNSLEKLEISAVIDTLYRFLWDEFAPWYLEFLKTDNRDLPFAKAVFGKYIVILSPFAPFVSQFLWENFFGKNDLLATLSWEDLEKLEDLESKNTTQNSNNSAEKDVEKSFENTKELKIENDFGVTRLPKIEEIDLEKIEKFENIVSFVTKIRSLRGLFGIDFGTSITILTDSSTLLQFAKFATHLAKVEIKETKIPALDFISIPQNHSNSQKQVEVQENVKQKILQNSNLDKKIEDQDLKNQDLEDKITNLENLFEIKIGQKDPIIGKIDLVSYIKDPQKQFEKAQKELENLGKQIEILQKQLKNPDFVNRAESEIIKQKQTDLEERLVDLNFQAQKIEFLKPLLAK